MGFLYKKKKRNFLGLSFIFFLFLVVTYFLLLDMSPSKNSTQSDLERHAELVKTLSEFDLVDIGERVPELPADLKDAKNILVTGGAGFM